MNTNWFYVSFFFVNWFKLSPCFYEFYISMVNVQLKLTEAAITFRINNRNLDFYFNC